MVPSIHPSQHAVHVPHSRALAVAGLDSEATGRGAIGMTTPQHFLYFCPLPQGQGSFLPAFMSGERNHQNNEILVYGTIVCIQGRLLQ
jgi:hypothetical protein